MTLWSSYLQDLPGPASIVEIHISICIPLSVFSVSMLTYEKYFYIIDQDVLCIYFVHEMLELNR